MVPPFTFRPLIADPPLDVRIAPVNWARDFQIIIILLLLLLF